ncbi:hypothetical protein TSAR_007107 [Trichomalopsis sarcophagae]|uniref:Uncharacterized protein n=1 Tax=Trichomalopsis sarcophagae TaxID=543379 RepID=A0A232EX15_9HYME|nr:hypothetical protein TSAR_007107 [Trichomalopsis sarcophagae]
MEKEVVKIHEEGFSLANYPPHDRETQHLSENQDDNSQLEFHSWPHMESEASKEGVGIYADAVQDHSEIPSQGLLAAQGPRSSRLVPL